MGIFSSLFRHTRPDRARSPKLTLEALSERIVPSTASVAIHAVTDNFGTSVVFYMQNGLLFESGYGKSPQLLSSFSGITSFSAGVDQNGYADCFFTNALSNNLAELNYRASTKAFLVKAVPGNSNVLSFAADGEGNVFFVNSDHSLHEYFGSTTGQFQLDGPASNTQAIDVVTQAFSAGDVVFALRPNGVLGDYVQSNYVVTMPLTGTVGIGTRWAPFHQLSGPDPIADFSAGLDQWGQADVYASDPHDQMWKWDLGNPGWQQVGRPNSINQFSATSYGQLDATLWNGTLVQYSNQVNGNKQSTLYNGASFKELSVPLATGVWSFNAATNGQYTNLYTVTANNASPAGELYNYFTLTGSWNQVAGPGQGGPAVT